MKNNQFLQVLFLSSSCLASNGTINCTDEDVFSNYEKYGTRYYTKKESSGCSSEVKLRPIHNSTSIEITYGARCKVDKDKIESVHDVARSLVEIIKVNSLGEAIKKRRVLEVKYSWKIGHWPIIKSINNDPSWPIDFFADLQKRYPDEDVRYSEYIKMLGSKILEKDVYLPFIDAMHKIGCKAKLMDYYADPIFMTKKFVTTKEYLNEVGVFNSERITKDYYPYFKSPISFTIDCQSNTL
jgi:hypothetical protein